jgi:hypothetical protein
LLNKNYFNKMNNSFNEIQILNNNTFNKLVSIDEFSVENNGIKEVVNLFMKK